MLRYAKALFICFLAVFFANYLMPGIDVIDHTKIPHLGTDLEFAVALGFLNSLIAPFLTLLNRRSYVLQVAIIALILNFAAYGLLHLISLDIHLSSIKDYLLVSFVVALVSFVVNYREAKRMRLLPLETIETREEL